MGRATKSTTMPTEEEFNKLKADHDRLANKIKEQEKHLSAKELELKKIEADKEDDEQAKLAAKGEYEKLLKQATEKHNKELAIAKAASDTAAQELDKTRKDLQNYKFSIELTKAFNSLNGNKEQLENFLTLASSSILLDDNGSPVLGNHKDLNSAVAELKEGKLGIFFNPTGTASGDGVSNPKSSGGESMITITKAEAQSGKMPDLTGKTYGVDYVFEE